jgi:hypothetical protein
MAADQAKVESHDAGSVQGRAARGGRRPRRSPELDRIQVYLIMLFTVCAFAAAVLSSVDFMPTGYFATLVFLGLAASITLYYFMDTVAEVRHKQYSVAGAGALFLIIIGAGHYVLSPQQQYEQTIQAFERRLSDEQAKVRYGELSITGLVQLNEAPPDGLREDQLVITLQPQNKQSWSSGANRLGFFVKAPVQLEQNGVVSTFTALVVEYFGYTSTSRIINPSDQNELGIIDFGEIRLSREETVAGRNEE